MQYINRRSFLAKSALAVGAGFAARGLRPSTWAAPAGANEAIRIGIIGLGVKGPQHLDELLKRKEKDIRITAICDVDQARIDRCLARFKGAGITPFATTDARKVFERSDVDAVVIATCNHWHALLSVWACQAGKDVYCEKPMTHTVWEGRKMIEAAAKYKRIVQVGTQRRSDIGLAEAVPWLHAGNLGKIKHLHCVFFQHRPSIGRRLPWYPTNLNFDLFCGPAPFAPLERKELHYDWHWTWDTGNGELGNNGVHELDAVLRLLPANRPLTRVMCLGGRFQLHDAGTTPNTQLVVYDHSGIPVVFENRGLPETPRDERMGAVKGRRESIFVYCEGGYLAGLTGAMAYDNDGKKIKQFTGDGGKGHMANFLAAVRSRRAQDLAAPVQIGHASASLCHYGNLSYRLGTPGDAAAGARAVAAVPEAAKVFAELQAHLAVHGIDYAKQPLSIGPWMNVDFANDQITAVAGGEADTLARAQYLLHEVQRTPYAIPEQV